MSLLLEMFTYPFIVRAFVVGILVSLCAALLGVPLVLKRYSMIGDGLSHVSFGALSIAVACGWAPLPVSIPVVILAALGLLRLTERSRMGADAAIAVVSASSLAAGVIVTSLTTGKMCIRDRLCREPRHRRQYLFHIRSARGSGRFCPCAHHRGHGR